MKWCFVFIILIVSSSAFSQRTDQPMLVYGKVSTTDGTPLNSAHIRDLAGNGKATVADKDGSFSLVVYQLPTKLEVSYVGYKSQTIPINRKDLVKDKIELFIELVLDSISLPPIPVRPDEKVETVFDPYKAYLFDYIFMDSQLLLLVSEGGQRRLQLLDESNNTVLKQNIGQAVFEFKEDCMGYYHLLGEDSAYQVILDEGQFVMFADILRSTLEEKLEPCVTCKGETCIVQGYRDHNQTKVFYRTNRQGNPTDSIYAITDKATKKFTESTYNEILAQVNVDPLQFAGEIDLNKLNVPRRLEQEIWFYTKILRKPIFCPLLPVNDNFYLFDHVNNELITFDSDGKLGKEITSTYNNKKRAGLKEILVDEEESRAFALFIKGGEVTVDEIDLETGGNKVGYAISEHQFPEKIRVKAGYAYYLYKDLGFENKYRLYRQRLN